MTDRLDQRLEALGDRLHDRTARSVGDVDDVYHRRERHDRRQRAGVLAGVVVLVLAGSVALATATRESLESQRLDLGGRSPTGQQTTQEPPAAVAPPTGPTSSLPPSTAATPTTAAVAAAPVNSDPKPPAPAPPSSSYRGYQLLYPFTSPEQAAELQAAYREGHQPWRPNPDADPGTIALAFAASIGFPEADKAFDTAMDDLGAHVTVGFASPGGDPVRMAIVHLVRLGTAADAPWEVVGTDDTLGLTLDTPRYGSTVTSPVTVGGLITGADESISVKAYRLDGQAPVGQTPGVPAGGDRTPWSSTMRLDPGPAGVVTIVAATGGHLAPVERFAVTGVRTA
jgi:hypothetical protein